MRFLLKILFAPILAALAVVTWFFVFVVSLSSGILCIPAAILGFFGLFILFVDSVSYGAGLLVIAFLISPYDGMFRGLAKKYNKYHEEALPKVMTPHTLRHTFCTNMANAGMNPKALQYIMGHSNITMTLNYYAHATFDSAKAEMLRIAA